MAERGSPPRMRGKVDDVGKLAKKEDTPTHLPMDVRSTCASAQEVSSDTTIAQNGAPVKKNIRGSPPRVRGKVAMEHFSIAICGITPAYAGKSSCSRPGSLSSRDHPRVCGEKCGDHLPRLVPKGSPPRVRGKGGRCPLRGLRDRITPACAGKSPQRGAALT